MCKCYIVVNPKIGTGEETLNKKKWRGLLMKDMNKRAQGNLIHSVLTQKIGKGREISYQKKQHDLWAKGTHKHTEA